VERLKVKLLPPDFLTMREYFPPVTAMTRHLVYPKIRVYKDGTLLRTTTAGSRSKINSAEVEFNVDLKDKSDVKVLVDVKVDDNGHGKVSLHFDTSLFELSINNS